MLNTEMPIHIPSTPPQNARKSMTVNLSIRSPVSALSSPPSIWTITAAICLLKWDEMRFKCYIEISIHDKLARLLLLFVLHIFVTSLDMWLVLDWYTCRQTIAFFAKYRASFFHLKFPFGCFQTQYTCSTTHFCLVVS